jgi:dTDP-4-dehydrorhamnose reductase
MKKILITGASGQLGASLQLNNYNIIRTDIILQDDQEHFKVLDITNEEQVNALLEKEKPDVIIHLAAMTNVDGCERNPNQAQLINVLGTENLLNYFTGKFIFVSSDYVFDGEDGPYTEDDDVNPINVYGKTKLEGEASVRKLSNDWVILRTNVVWNIGGNFKASFADWVVDELQSNRHIRIVADQWNNPAWTVDLGNVIETLIQHDANGLYHHGSSRIINRYDFACMIANVYELNSSLIEPITTKELNQSAQRPLKCGLITKKLENDFNFTPSKTISDIKAAKYQTEL